MNPSPATPERTQAAASGSALRHLASNIRFWTVAVGVLLLDLWSKSAAFSKLPPDDAVTIIPKVLEFRRSLNDGAVFGSFTGYVGVFMIASVCAVGFVVYLFAHCHRRQYVLHAALAMILAGALGNLYDRGWVQADVLTFRAGPSQGRSLIGIVVSDPGADEVLLGEWPDRSNVRTFSADTVVVKRQGVVRDFIKFVPVFPAWVPKLGGRDVWPWIFNVADAALVIGVIVLLLHSFVDRGGRGHAEAEGQ